MGFKIFQQCTFSRNWHNTVNQLYFNKRNKYFFKKYLKLLNLEWISNEALLYSTKNHIQSLGIKHDERQYEKKNVYI